METEKNKEDKITVDYVLDKMCNDYYIKETLKTIGSMYTTLDYAHSYIHFSDVLIYGYKTFCKIKEAEPDTDLDSQKLAIILAYHDLGRIMGVKNHAENSAVMLEHNSIIVHPKNYDYFTIAMMQEVIIEHNKDSVSSLYSAILKDSDKSYRLDINKYIGRIYCSRDYYFKDKDYNEIIPLIVNKIKNSHYDAKVVYNHNEFEKANSICENITIEEVEKILEYNHFFNL